MIVVPGAVITSKGELQSIVTVGDEPDSVVVSTIVSVVVIVVVEVVVVASVVAFVVESIYIMIISYYNGIERKLGFKLSTHDKIIVNKVPVQYWTS